MINVSLYTVLFVGEALVVTILLALYFFFRSKKYQPYYQASESPKKALKEYLVEEISHTRDYMKSIDLHAKKQDETALTRQRNLDMRVKWLDIEKDFIETPDTVSVYWKKLCKKIDVFFENWQSPNASFENVANKSTLEGLENDPDEDIILLSSEGDHHDAAIHDSDFSKEREALLTEIKQLSHENNNHKRTVKDLWNYKQFFLDMQKTYDQLNKKYKKLYNTLSNMQLQPDQIDQLQPILSEGNDDELEQQVQSLAQENERLQNEMDQMEAIFNLQREATGQNSTIANNATTETPLIETSHSETTMPSATELDANKAHCQPKAEMSPFEQS